MYHCTRPPPCLQPSYETEWHLTRWQTILGKVSTTSACRIAWMSVVATKSTSNNIDTNVVIYYYTRPPPCQKPSYEIEWHLTRWQTIPRPVSTTSVWHNTWMPVVDNKTASNNIDMNVVMYHCTRPPPCLQPSYETEWQLTRWRTILGKVSSTSVYRITWMSVVAYKSTSNNIDANVVIYPCTRPPPCLQRSFATRSYLVRWRTLLRSVTNTF